MAWNETAHEEYRRGTPRYESDLTDGGRAVAGPPPPSRPGRRRTTDLREASSAVRHMPATGCRWRAVPGRFPPFKTVRNHFHA